MTPPSSRLSRDSQAQLNSDVVSCNRCPRLRIYCRNVADEKRKMFRDEEYWGKPVPDFGDPNAQVLIVGLAPAAHGGNRTGRMFTGDRSGEWLYRALYRARFANQPTSLSLNDGLELIDCTITATAHCAPPDNKPTKEEIANCSEYLKRSFAIYNPRVVIALGAIGWNAVIDDLKRREIWTSARPKFAHGAETLVAPGMTLLGSYHPSQQNTFTGRLTEPMFDSVFNRAKELISSPRQ